MERFFVEIKLPHDVSQDFRNTLKSHDIKYVPIISGSSPCANPEVTHEALMWSKLAIELISSAAIWGAVGTAIIAFSRRHKHKTIFIEKDGFKFQATGMKPEDLIKSLEGATKLLLTTQNNENE